MLSGIMRGRTKWEQVVAEVGMAGTKWPGAARRYGVEAEGSVGDLGEWIRVDRAVRQQRVDAEWGVGETGADMVAMHGKDHSWKWN